MDVNLPKEEDMEISIRIPEWSKNTTLSINGKAVTDIQPGTYAKIKRSWHTGDKIALQLDMRGRVIKTGTAIQSEAIVRGPIVLARDTRFEGSGIAAVLKPVANKDAYIELTEPPNKPTDDGMMLFKANFIPESYTEAAKGPIAVTLCDYASAGNNRENSFFEVWSAQLFHPSDEF